MWSYERLWIMLVKKKLKKTDLLRLAHINTTALSKLGKGQPVTMDCLAKLCTALQCELEDIVQFIPDGKEQ